MRRGGAVKQGGWAAGSLIVEGSVGEEEDFDVVDWGTGSQ